MRDNLLDELFEEIQGSKELKRTEKRMLLAQKIDQGMKEKGWTKSQFAEKIGEKPNVITRWLSGTHNFTSDTLSDIEDVLGINLLDTSIEKSQLSIVVEVSSIPLSDKYSIANIYRNSIPLKEKDNYLN